MDGLRIEGLQAAIDADALAAGRVAARIDHVRVCLTTESLIRLSANASFPASIERVEDGKLHAHVRKGGRNVGAEINLSVDAVGRIVAEVGAVRLGGIRLPGGLMGLFSGLFANQLPDGVTLDCNRITIDHREMAAARGIGIGPVSSVRVSPQEIVLEL